MGSRRRSRRNGYMQPRGEGKRCDPQQVCPRPGRLIVLRELVCRGEKERRSQTRPFAIGRIADMHGVTHYPNGHHPKLRRRRFLQTFGRYQEMLRDTGRVGARSGCGRRGRMHGKSTMLVKHELGTWFFLGWTILRRSILAPPIRPVRNRCGTVRAASTACPTGPRLVAFTRVGSAAIASLISRAKTQVGIRWNCGR